MSVEVDGEVETQNTNGIVRGTVERFPPSLFLRDTALTQADAAIRDFAQSVRAASGGDDPRASCTACSTGCTRTWPTTPTRADTAPANAAEAFARKRGQSQDLTHIFIGAAHSLGIPARYVGGYFRRDDGGRDQEAGHAWAEAFVPDLGWVAFDPANGFCPTDAHVRVAVGLDALGAAPVRGTRYGGGAETLEVAIKVGQ